MFTRVVGAGVTSSANRLAAFSPCGRLCAISPTIAANPTNIICGIVIRTNATPNSSFAGCCVWHGAGAGYASNSSLTTTGRPRFCFVAMAKDHSGCASLITIAKFRVITVVAATTTATQCYVKEITRIIVRIDDHDSATSTSATAILRGIGRH
jgi:hypothetical protein